MTAKPAKTRKPARLYTLWHSGRRWRLLLVLGMLLLAALYPVVCYTIMLRSGAPIYANSSKLPATRAALVLGTTPRMADGSPNEFFTTRMQAAADLYNRGIVQRLLVSGAVENQWYNETRDMRRALEALGIPRHAIVEDQLGLRTFDSVARAQHIYGQDSVIIVSQWFHLERALYIARQTGLHAWGYPAANPRYRGHMLRAHLREVLARSLTVAECLLWNRNPTFTEEKMPL